MIMLMFMLMDDTVILASSRERAIEKICVLEEFVRHRE
jgi:hypothetical protein